MILRAEGCAKIDDKLYFMNIDSNVFFSINVNAGNIVYEGSIPNEHKNTYRCARIFSYKRILIFIPINSKNVSFFDVDRKIWKQIEVDCSKGYKKNKFFSAHIYNDKLFLVGAAYPAIMVINMNDYSVDYIMGIFDERIKDSNYAQDCFVRVDTVLKENKLYMASCVSNHICIVNLDNYSWKWKKIGDSYNRYSGIAWDGRRFWLAPRYRGSIIIWDSVADVIKPLCRNMQYKNFTGVVFDGRYIIFPGMNQKRTLYIDSKSDDFADDNVIEREECYIFFENRSGYNYAMTDTGEFVVYAAEKINGIRKKYRFVVGNNSEFVKNSFETGCVNFESEFMTLDDYIGII